jgi:hypothetical protein
VAEPLSRDNRRLIRELLARYVETEFDNFALYVSTRRLGGRSTEAPRRRAPRGRAAVRGGIVTTFAFHEQVG